MNKSVRNFLTLLLSIVLVLFIAELERAEMNAVYNVVTSLNRLLSYRYFIIAPLMLKCVLEEKTIGADNESQIF